MASIVVDDVPAAHFRPPSAAISQISHVRTSQVYLETLVPAAIVSSRVSQTYVEPATQTPESLQVTQVYLEVMSKGQGEAETTFVGSLDFAAEVEHRLGPGWFNLPPPDVSAARVAAGRWALHYFHVKPRREERS